MFSWIINTFFYKPFIFVDIIKPFIVKLMQKSNKNKENRDKNRALYLNDGA